MKIQKLIQKSPRIRPMYLTIRLLNSEYPIFSAKGSYTSPLALQCLNENRIISTAIPILSVWANATIWLSIVIRHIISAIIW